MKESTVEILCLIMEFKIATGWHISRFVKGKDGSKYIYTKLRRMWQAGLLESFKVYSGSLAGVPLFYILSKDGLKILQEYGRYEKADLQNYPEAKELLSWGIFKHESQIVELASLEVKNKTDTLQINLKGEKSSVSRELLSNKNVEILTPDYIVFYRTDSTDYLIYSEFERTAKSKEAILRKIERYVNYHSPEQRQNKTLRLIFQTPAMEQSFWLNIIINGFSLLQKLRILTTNLSLIKTHHDFIEPIYLSESEIKLVKQGLLKVEGTQRIKLFHFL